MDTREIAVAYRLTHWAGILRERQASGMVYSIIETAKANGLKPFDYLKFLFETLPNATSSQLPSLLPWGDAVPVGCRVP
jgi:hypothetical protein